MLPQHLALSSIVMAIGGVLGYGLAYLLRRYLPPSTIPWLLLVPWRALTAFYLLNYLVKPNLAEQIGLGPTTGIISAIIPVTVIAAALTLKSTETIQSRGAEFAWLRTVGVASVTLFTLAALGGGGTRLSVLFLLRVTDSQSTELSTWLVLLSLLIFDLSLGILELITARRRFGRA